MNAPPRAASTVTARSTATASVRSPAAASARPASSRAASSSRRAPMRPAASAAAMRDAAGLGRVAAGQQQLRLRARGADRAGRQRHRARRGGPARRPTRAPRRSAVGGDRGAHGTSRSHVRHVSSTPSSIGPPAAVISRRQRSGSCSSWIAATAQRPVRVATLGLQLVEQLGGLVGGARGLGALAAVVVQERLGPQRGWSMLRTPCSRAPSSATSTSASASPRFSRCCWSCARVIASWPSRPSWRVARATESARSSVA